MATAARALLKQMSTKLKAGALVVVLLGIAALFLWQQQQIKRLTDENADLRTQLNQMASLRDSNGHFAEQLKALLKPHKWTGASWYGCAVKECGCASLSRRTPN